MRSVDGGAVPVVLIQDRKSTRLNSSHGYISYAVFCLKKKNSALLLGPGGNSHVAGPAACSQLHQFAHTAFACHPDRLLHAHVRGVALIRGRPRPGATALARLNT